MLDRGAFTGVGRGDAADPGPVDVAEAEPYAVAHNRIRFHGKAAHAAAYPERGRNAADVFTVAQVAIGLLRQELPPSVRVHGVQTRGGEGPQRDPRTHRRAVGRMGSNLDELERIEPRVRRCFEAGALATGCELEIEPESPPYSEFVDDPRPTARSRREAARRRPNLRHRRRPGRRDEPGVHRSRQRLTSRSRTAPRPGIGSLPAVNHQREFAAAAVTPAADRTLLDGATALARTAAVTAADL